MDSSREAKHEEERGKDEAASLVDVNLMVVLLSQFCTKDELNDNNLEKEKRDHAAHEIRESRARANKRFMKETKVMEKRTHVLQPMAKEFR
ncbi:unnamed protein product [Eruca vesicaria subsp. sativa]|uniref:Uncharacterized protein n=1 Tax=Eruca vesicaria subsp. sativa TaxID=29727 RepID=A0ABC8LT24_ERUVS|nr:unnamed protein product [Eruca vesicaria subsp. sativa]